MPHALPDTVLIRAALTLHPQQGDAPRRFTMRAYDGGRLRLPNFPVPVVVDLAGMGQREQIKALLHHDPAQPIGHMDTVSITDVIDLGGVLSIPDNAAKIAAAQRNGFKWDASIGATFDRHTVEMVRPGQRVEVNNRWFTGPIAVVRKSTLTESSFTGLGAGENTAALTASHAIPISEAEMPGTHTAETATETQTETPDAGIAQAVAEVKGLQVEIKASLDALKQEREELQTARQELVRQRCAEAVDRFAAQHRFADGEILASLRQKAAAGDLSENQAELEILRASMGRRATGFDTVGGKSGAPAVPHVLEAALCLTNGWTPEDLGRHFDQNTINAALAPRFRGFGIRGLMVEYLRSHGHDCIGGRPGDDDIQASLRFAEQESLQASFSTLSLPGILSNVARKELLRGRDSIESAILKIARRGTTNDYKPFYMYRLNTMGLLEQVGPDGELKAITLAEDEYSNRVYPFGRKLSITNVMVRNDDMGAFNDLARLFGVMAMMTIEKTGFTKLLSAQSTYWTTGKGNRVAAGASAALSIDSLGSAYQLFLQMTGADGEPIMVNPKYLLVAPRDAVQARSLNTDTNITVEVAGSTDTTIRQTTGNPWRGMFEPLHSPYLANGKVTNANGTQWLLAGDPSVSAPLAVAFLDGRSDPQIQTWESLPGKSGMQWDVKLDFGFALHDDKASVLSPGQ